MRDVPVAVIEVECRRCDSRDVLERAALVKMHGAGISLARLRRRLAIGCDQMCHPEGDRCETRFPCLDG
ncbi:hypothetical protein ELH93_19510 [Rhizobium leguminosarum]|nr:hypothetical protein ELH93_19510 [Rhizobium leguminosarum]